MLPKSCFKLLFLWQKKFQEQLQTTPKTQLNKLNNIHLNKLQFHQSIINNPHIYYSFCLLTQQIYLSPFTPQPHITNHIPLPILNSNPNKTMIRLLHKNHIAEDAIYNLRWLILSYLIISSRQRIYLFLYSIYLSLKFIFPSFNRQYMYLCLRYHYKNHPKTLFNLNSSSSPLVKSFFRSPKLITTSFKIGSMNFMSCQQAILFFSQRFLKIFS